MNQALSARAGTSPATEGLAAINAAVVALPQEINYGLLALAPLGAAYGARGIVAALFASCFGVLAAIAAGIRFGQVLGSRPTLSLIIAALAANLGQNSTTAGTAPLAEIFLVIVLAGLLQLLFAKLGVGRLIKYLPYPVLAGFMNGVAGLLLLSAARKLFEDAYLGAWLVAGVTLWVALRPARRGPLAQVPGAMQAVTAGMVLHHLLAWLPAAPRVGATLPALQVQWPQWELLQELHLFLQPALCWHLLPFAFAIALISSLETLLTAATIDGMTGKRSSSERELLAVGFANVCCGLLGGTPIAGSLSRSGMLLSGGAQRRGAMTAYALVFGFFAFVALPLLSFLPQAVIAAVMLLVANQMVNEWTRKLLRQVTVERGQVSRPEQRDLDLQFAVMLAVAVTAVLADLKEAVLLGVLLAMVLFIHANTRLPFRRVVRGSARRSLKWRGDEAQRWLEKHGDAIALIEAEGILFFGTVDRLAREVEKVAESARYIILDLRRVIDIDATGARIFQQMAQRLRRQGVTLLLSHIRQDETRARFLRSMGVDRDVPAELFYDDDETALEVAEDALLAEGLGAQVRDRRRSLAESDLGRGLSQEELDLLGDYMSQRTMQAGEVIFAQGDTGRSLFVVLRGTVSIRVRLENAIHKRIVAFGPGVSFGEMALLEGLARSADAVADTDGELLALSEADFLRLRREHPLLVAQLLQNLARLLAERLRLTTQDLRRVLAD